MVKEAPIRPPLELPDLSATLDAPKFLPHAEMRGGGSGRPPMSSESKEYWEGVNPGLDLSGKRSSGRGKVERVYRPPKPKDQRVIVPIEKEWDCGCSFRRDAEGTEYLSECSDDHCQRPGH